MFLSLGINCADLTLWRRPNLVIARWFHHCEEGGASIEETAWSSHGFSNAKMIASASKFHAPILAREKVPSA
jgi:hypothetical protein